MIPLDHKHMVECFYPAWCAGFTKERNEMGWRLEGVVPFTRHQLWKLRGIKSSSSPWEVASNHLSTRLSDNRPISVDRRLSTGTTSAPGGALELCIPVNVKQAVDKATRLPSVQQLVASIAPSQEGNPDGTFWMAEALKARELLDTLSSFIHAAQAANSSTGEVVDGRATRGVRVTAAQIWALHGSATGEEAMQLQAAKAAERMQKEAGTEARQEAAALRRREGVSNSITNGLRLLQEIVLKGESVISSFKLEDLKDLLVHADPTGAAPKGKKPELFARVKELESVKKAVADYVAAQVQQMVFRGPVPPAPPAPEQLTLPANPQQTNTLTPDSLGLTASGIVMDSMVSCLLVSDHGPNTM